jgi:hypothetical protein
MREVWFTAAIVASAGAVVTDNPRIRIVAVLVAILFWWVFGATQHYGRLVQDQTQPNKDA